MRKVNPVQMAPPVNVVTPAYLDRSVRKVTLVCPARLVDLGAVERLANLVTQDHVDRQGYLDRRVKKVNKVFQALQVVFRTLDQKVNVVNPDLQVPPGLKVLSDRRVMLGLPELLVSQANPVNKVPQDPWV